MNSDTLLLSMYSFPFCMGMAFAFLASKKGFNPKRSNISDLMWHGYAVGYLVSVLSAGLLALISLLLFSGMPVAGIITYTLLTSFFVAIISPIVGLILYLPCSYLGCNLAAQKRAEAELARTQQQMIEEREKELESSQRDRN